jgi:hypothetical protein
MKMDVYRQFDSQNSETGAIVKEWNYYKTIPCHAKGVITNSATARAGDRQSFSNKYDNEQVIQIKTIEKITLREKITNITDKNKNVIWEELNFPTNTPTVFEVVGTTPVTDPFGTVIAYNSVLKRSENQQIGQ